MFYLLSHLKQRTIGASVLTGVAVLVIVAIKSALSAFKGSGSRCGHLRKNNFDSGVLLLFRAKAGLHFGNSHFVNPFDLVKHTFVKLFQPSAAFNNNRSYIIAQSILIARGKMSKIVVEQNFFRKVV